MLILITLCYLSQADANPLPWVDTSPLRIHQWYSPRVGDDVLLGKPLREKDSRGLYGTNARGEIQVGQAVGSAHLKNFERERTREELIELIEQDELILFSPLTPGKIVALHVVESAAGKQTTVAVKILEGRYKGKLYGFDLGEVHLEDKRPRVGKRPPPIIIHFRRAEPSILSNSGGRAGR